MEHTSGWSLAIIGLFLLAGYAAYAVSSRIRIPRVTILLVIGAICSSSVLDIIPEQASEWFPLIAHIALSMVGFLLGENFVGKQLKEKGPAVLWISITETLGAVLMVFVALLIAGAPLPLALVLAGIAPASAPAAIYETVRELKAKGQLTDTVLGIVAIDDAWGVISFSICFVIAKSLTGTNGNEQTILEGLWEVFGALLIGGAVGLPMAWLTGHVRQGEPTLIEAGGFVLFCSGVATLLGVSYLLSSMILGAVVANRARHHTRPFHAIEGVSEPFLAVFFLLAGLRFDLSTLQSLGIIGAAYIVARAAGLIAGGTVGGLLCRIPHQISTRVGFCLLPQAGVALGFALMAQEQMPEIGNAVLPLVIATTVLFEMTGPLLVRYHIAKAGEIGQKPDNDQHDDD